MTSVFESVKLAIETDNSITFEALTGYYKLKPVEIVGLLEFCESRFGFTGKRGNSYDYVSKLVQYASCDPVVGQVKPSERTVEWMISQMPPSVIKKALGIWIMDPADAIRKAMGWKREDTVLALLEHIEGDKCDQLMTEIYEFAIREYVDSVFDALIARVRPNRAVLGYALAFGTRIHLARVIEFCEDTSVLTDGSLRLRWLIETGDASLVKEALATTKAELTNETLDFVGNRGTPEIAMAVIKHIKAQPVKKGRVNINGQPYVVVPEWAV